MVLNALRARTGWRRALALALVFAFTAGVVHVHGSGAAQAADMTIIASGHDDGHSHDHGDVPAPSVSSHCTFCAVVAGKFYLPSYEPAGVPTLSVRIVYRGPSAPMIVSPSADLFRPPIALLG